MNAELPFTHCSLLQSGALKIFAKAGDPNGGTRIQGQLLEWPAYDEKTGALINLTSSPSIASVPPDSFPGCSFFDAKWDFYSGCLPP